MTSIDQLRETLRQNPESIAFAEVVALIDNAYAYTPCAFSNGSVSNAIGKNEGSCKIFAFAKLQQLDESQALALFGDFYRRDVLEHPEADDHANIRQFMRTGWAGITFEGIALKPR